MSIHVVYQWSIRPEESAACEDQLARVVEHIRADHGDILGVRTLRQWSGPLPRRAYIWMEEYPSLSSLESGGGDSPTCLEVWKPLEAMAQPGTWTLRVGVDAGERLQLTR